MTRILDPAEHREIAAWDQYGGKGEGCAVRCRCGETFSGYASVDDARIDLAEHIRAAKTS